MFGLTSLIADDVREARRDSFFADDADIGPFPSATFDQYTREGLRAYAYFLKTCPSVVCWMDENGVDPKSRIRLLGRLVFRAEGDHLSPRSQIPAGTRDPRLVHQGGGEEPPHQVGGVL